MKDIEESPSKVCVVVGVGEGLGAALARRFAERYKVGLIARSPEVITKTAGEIRAVGGVALPLQSDATMQAQVAAAHEQITRELGPVEILIYNGGRRPIGRLMETSPETFENTWRLHTLGAFLWARQVVPAMLSRSSGCILITGATAGIRPWPNSAAFAPAKFAVRGLAQVMARDLHPQVSTLAISMWTAASICPYCGSCSQKRRTKSSSSQRQFGGFLVPRAPGSQRMDA